ncbi:hypothetical protein EW026_g1279 [Hermanssonia centrifuga]|uniref:FAD-binding domain-containing protein n=1 Tax=Hermanssonia centrifuga TaxID=98765 RepID=A0A4S4KS55_9APHY|nr:hypothetical protein EW026_g1279 [Hermanssonia centrifuga]
MAVQISPSLTASPPDRIPPAQSACMQLRLRYDLYNRALDEIGCAEPLIAACVKAGGGKIWNGDRFHYMGDYSALAPYTKFPFLALIPQYVTERILGERLLEEGIKVHRPFKVVDLKVNELDPNITDAIFEDGQVVEARYIVGADGARSIVRQTAGIRYADPDGDDITGKPIKQAIAADVVFTSPHYAAPNEAFFVLSSGNFFISVPMPGSSYDGQEVWRIGFGVSQGVPPQFPSTEYLQDLLDAYGPACIPSSAMPDRVPLKIKKTIWSTRFRTHSAIAETPFTRLFDKGGVIVLVGDAAHLHPPTGGQGMNLGLRDSVFLGPILAEHLKRSTQASATYERAELDEPLKQWAAVRHAHALKIISVAKRMLAVFSCKNEITWYFGVIPINWMKVRNIGMWISELTGYSRRMNAWNLSGLASR